MADKSIRAQSDQVSAMAKPWNMIDALMEGTPAMRASGKTFLPQWPKEPDDSYQRRLGTAVLHPVFKRTVLVNAARPFSRPMKLETAARVQEWTSNIDNQGTDLGAFAVQLMVGCLSKGLIGVLVDYPKADGVRTQSDEKAAGVRPYFVKYLANSILGWKAEQTTGALKLTQLRLLEMAEIPNGEYGMKAVEQVRVLTPGAWATYQESKEKKDEWLEVDSGKTTLTFIPFQFFYGVRQAFGVGCSPLLDLAYQNVEHWQSASDQQTILHVARVPLLFAKCFGDGEITIGAASAASSDNEKAELEYVEHSGAAIEAGTVSLTNLEDRMRSTGAELVALQVGLITATQVSADGEATRSLLQQIVEVFEDSMEACLDFMGEWVGDKSPATVELHKEYGLAASNDGQALVGAKKAGAISAKTLFQELQRRDVVSQDRNWDDESKQLGTEAKAAQAAQQEPDPEPV